MMHRQRGQAFILVLILLAVGGLLITPSLNLSFTGLQSRMAQHNTLMEYYAADGAQEYSLWRLRNSDFVADLINSEEGEVGPFYIVLNRVQAEYSITWQAAEDAPPGGSPLTEFTTDRYKITVIVTPAYLPVAPGDTVLFTYTITLQYMYPDVPTQDLTDLWVDVPPGFTYKDYSTSGVANIEPTRSGSPDQGYRYKWSFPTPISFDYWQKKVMSFEATATPPEGAYYIQVEARIGGIRRGSTGPTTPIIVVAVTPETDIPRLVVDKDVPPEERVIPPGVPTLLTYTIYLTNLSSVSDIKVELIEDALPAGFSYAGGDSGFLLDGNLQNPTYVADGTRWLLEWKFVPVSTTLVIPPGETVTATFQVIAIVEASGTYANEIRVKAQRADTGDYSWPTGEVIVPQFDIESTSGGTTLRVVTVVSGGSHNIKSWVVE